jgi:hypothetical protein
LDQLPPSQEEFVRLDMACASTTSTPSLVARKLNLKRRDDPPGHLVLNRKNVALEAVRSVPDFRIDSADRHTPWPGWVPTRYEQKALRAGRRPHYLIFERR